MGKWRALFEANLPPEDKREYGEQYQFGPPATEEQLAAAEQSLGLKLPTAIRELLSEFNGVWYTTRLDRKQGCEPSILYLDLDSMAVRVPHYFRTCGNPLPPEDELRRVVFIAQSNGFADLWGVCAESVGGHPAGAVVKLDHEIGELEARHPSLTDFVRNGRK